MAEARAVSPLEKAARAIARLDAPYHADQFDLLSAEMQIRYRHYVFAILEAIAEPDDEMLSAGVSAMAGYDPGWESLGKRIEETHRAMIQSILARK